MHLETHLRALLETAQAQGLLRVPETYETEGAAVRGAGGAWISFASNDYLGLAEHPSLRAALARGAERLAGAGSSRVVAGTSQAHRDAEASLASLVGLPAARVFSSAYAANVGVLGSLFGRADVLLCDALNHASLIDGARLTRARVEIYRHGDLDHLEALLRAHHPSGVVAVVSETVFSMDGDVADVARLARLAHEHGAALVVDEAHALGVIGPSGRGVCAAAGVTPDVLVGGLGKAFGLAGGFVAGTPSLARAIDNFGRTFVFSTAVLPALAWAVPTATQLLLDAEPARTTLQAHADAVRRHARRLRLEALGRAPGVIVPVILGAPEAAMRAAERLRAHGVLVPAMRPPTVAAGTSRLRITPTALHTDADLARLGAALDGALASPRDGDHGDQPEHT